MKKSFIVTLLVLFNIFCNAQNEEIDPSNEDIEQAVASANEWLEKVDSSSYTQSWEAASELFKKSITTKKWADVLEGVRSPLGDVEKRELQTKEYRTTLPGAPDGEYLVIVYKTEFENKQNSFETVTPMKDKDGKWRVSGYYIK